VRSGIGRALDQAVADLVAAVGLQELAFSGEGVFASTVSGCDPAGVGQGGLVQRRCAVQRPPAYAPPPSFGSCLMTSAAVPAPVILCRWRLFLRFWQGMTLTPLSVS